MRATVVRDGRRTRVAVTEVVPGDVVIVAEGNRVPADARLLEGRWRSTCPPSPGQSALVPRSADRTG
ncbi:hypothetical protein [Actinokineospora globicatena]|uniref:P-type ATPase n=1 Tax=Actinokineospora globicatena TaxID=103729 RepID=UPI00355815FF